MDLADKFTLFVCLFHQKCKNIHFFVPFTSAESLECWGSCDIIRRLCKRYIIIILERRGKEMKAFLILEDGTVFEGTHIGADKEVISEIVFNTSMAGYLEVLTDPSYAGRQSA